MRIRAITAIASRSHWSCDVTRGEDEHLVFLGQSPQVFPILSNTLLALVDYRPPPTLAAPIHQLATQPANTLAILLLPL